MRVLAGSASARLGQALADRLGAPRVAVETKVFPDGEVYARVAGSLRGEEAVVVQTTYPNDKLVELLLLQDAAREAGAASVTTVVPYFAYSRQDVAFKEGEGVSARAIARAVASGADRVVTVDPHKDHILGFFPDLAIGASAVPDIADALRGADLVLAPDKGALERARVAAERLDVPVDHLEKTRLSGTEVRMAPKSLPVAGKTVAILDDIISTGGTIAMAAGALKAQGATRVVAACTHGLFLGDALDRLRKAGCDDVFATDTIEGAASKVSAAGAIARALGR